MVKVGLAPIRPSAGITRHDYTLAPAATQVIPAGICMLTGPEGSIATTKVNVEAQGPLGTWAIITEGQNMYKLFMSDGINMRLINDDGVETFTVYVYVWS